MASELFDGRGRRLYLTREERQAVLAAAESPEGFADPCRGVPAQPLQRWLGHASSARPRGAAAQL